MRAVAAECRGKLPRGTAGPFCPLRHRAVASAPSERGLPSEARLGEYSVRDGAAPGAEGAGRAVHGVLPPALRAIPLSEGGGSGAAGFARRRESPAANAFAIATAFCYPSANHKTRPGDFP